MLFFRKDLLSYPESPEKSFKTHFKTLKCKGDTISQKNTSKFFSRNPKFQARLVPKRAKCYEKTPEWDNGASIFCFNNVWAFQKT